jgi:imidazole glycerol phosphate synthase, glutamine amidotransferase subunit
MYTIINYNAGNIASIKNILDKIGIDCIISSETKDIIKAEKLILPGVGAFDHGMQNLNHLRLSEVIKNRVLDGVPILGICLGAQMLGISSAEGDLPGLGLINMNVIKFDLRKLPIGFKIPHMGWNEVKLKKNHMLFNDSFTNPRFYFVHSYHFEMQNPDDILTTSIYGYEFTSSFQKDNIIGVQFHPEKSHKFGMQLLKKFAEM